MIASAGVRAASVQQEHAQRPPNGCAATSFRLPRSARSARTARQVEAHAFFNRAADQIAWTEECCESLDGQSSRCRERAALPCENARFQGGL